MTIRPRWRHTRTYADTVRHRYHRDVLVFANADLFAYTGLGLIGPFLGLYLTQHLGLSPSIAGIALGLYGGAKVVSTSGAGLLALVVKQKWILIVSAATAAVTFLLMAGTSDAHVAVALLVLLGLATGMYLPTERSRVVDVVHPSQLPGSFGLLEMAQNAGWIAGPALGAYLATVSYPILFFTSGVAFGIATVVLLRKLSDDRESPQPGETDAENTQISVHGQHDESSSSLEKSLGRQPRFFVFLVLIFLFSVAEDQWFTMLPIYTAQRWDTPTSLWGVLFVINGVCIVLFQIPVIRLVQRIGKLQAIAIGMTAFAGAYIVIVGINSAALAIPLLGASIVILTFGEIVLGPMLPTAASSFSLGKRSAANQGRLLVAIASGALVGPIVGGWVLDNFPPDVLWIGAAAVSLASALGLVLLARLTPLDVRPG